MPSGAVEALVRRWEAGGLEPHGLTVLRHGHVVAEASWAPYDADGVALVYSVSKTFTACAVGLAVNEGLLALDDRLVEIFPEAAHLAGPRAAALTLHDVLAMRTGHRSDTLVWRSADLTAFPTAFLAHEPEEDRGWFVYHNGATLMAGLAVQRRSGGRLLDYLRPRLFTPLGVDTAAWSGSRGVDQGFSGLHVTTEALARLGELVLRDGVWQGARLLPEGWVARMTAVHTDTAHHPDPPDWQQGYGYQMWRCRHGAVRADGAYGQFSVVVPAADLVLALTSCTEGTQETLDAVWEELLPALADAPLPRDDAAHASLTDLLRGAVLDGPSPAADAPTTAPSVPASGGWSFTHRPTDEVPALTAVEVERTGDGWTVVVVEEPGGRTVVPCGDGSWRRADGPYAGRGAWTAPDTFEAAVVAVETPHVLHLWCRDGLVSARWNGVPLSRPTLATTRAPRA